MFKVFIIICASNQLMKASYPSITSYRCKNRWDISKHDYEHLKKVKTKQESRKHKFSNFSEVKQYFLKLIYIKWDFAFKISKTYLRIKMKGYRQISKNLVQNPVVLY